MSIYYQKLHHDLLTHKRDILNALDHSVRWGNTFSRAHGPLAPSTSHSSSALSIPLYRPTTVLLAFLVIHSFTPSNHCLAGLPGDPFLYTVQPLSCWPSWWSIPLHRPTTVLLAFLVIFPPQFYPASWCLPGFLSLSRHVINNDIHAPNKDGVTLVVNQPSVGVQTFHERCFIQTRSKQNRVPRYKFHIQKLSRR